MSDADAIVIGGGLAGAAAAAHLAAAGRGVVLFERAAGAHHKVCGEFLSGDAVGYLRALGIDPAVLGASEIGHVRIRAGGRDAGAALPFPAYGLSRRLLDERLLVHAADRGVELRRGLAVRRLERSNGLWQVDGVRAPAVLLATGKHDLRGHGRPTDAGADLIGFKMHLRLAPGSAARLVGAVEILLYDGGYAGLQLVEGGTANLCLLVSRRGYASLGRRWDRLLARLGEATPAFAAYLDGAQPLMDSPAAVAGIPYGHVHCPRPADPPGLYRLGDQFAVISSFVGDGMAIALHSARVVVSELLAGREALAYHRTLRRDVRPAVRDARLVSSAVRGPLGRGAILAACRLAPPLMTWLAARTRMPARADPPACPVARKAAGA
ncbi:MAG TPA: FAD-dependent monooxygenase [Alphaproteobacteria bacterium]|nr:FAD-dependent monooxygenase [Alphaproteobacteria bacterium]